MNKTKIEWCDYTVNPVKGLCPMACPYCYARAMYKRFKWNPEIRFDFGAMDLFGAKPESKFFIGSTIELFGEWVKPEWLEKLFSVCADWSGHTFLFLTKLPQNLIKWSPFPSNCWVGVTATNPQAFHEAELYLQRIEATIKFISIEPLLERFWLTWISSLIDWIIIGTQTPYSSKTAPRKQWIDEIVDAADRTEIPVFLKDNLRPVLKAVYGNDIPLRQEFPQINIKLG